MPNLNKVFLMGNLTRDPELRYTPNGTAVADIGLAVNRRRRGQDGETREETLFVDITAWARTAEVISEYLRKGSPIFIEGRLQLDTWEAQDGSKRSKMRVVVESFEFLDSRGGGAQGGGRPPQGGQAGRREPRSEGGLGGAPAAEGGGTGPPPDEGFAGDDDVPF